MNWIALMTAVYVGAMLAYITYFGVTYYLSWKLAQSGNETDFATKPGEVKTSGGFVSMIEPEEPDGGEGMDQGSYRI